jgi:hypothetical protein
MGGRIFPVPIAIPRDFEGLDAMCNTQPGSSKQSLRMKNVNNLPIEPCDVASIRAL